MKSLLVFGLCIAFIATTQADGYYRWVDKQGVIHYSDTPPDDENTAVEERKFPNDITNKKPTNADDDIATSSPTVDLESLDVDQLNCQIAKENLAMIEQKNLLYVANGDGTKRFLTHDEVEAKKADSLALVNSSCKPAS